MDWTNLMSHSQATRINHLDPTDITTIIALTSHSQKPADILRIARAITVGETPPIPDTILSTTGPKPLRIIAHSFVRDPKQYHATYGMSDEEAQRLAMLLRVRPEEACEEIGSVVRRKVEGKGSGREVEVFAMQQPQAQSQQGTQNTVNVEGDGGAKELAAEEARNPMCGQYQFSAEPTGLTGPYQFGVHLGDDLFAIGQSKKVAIAAARLCRIKGRFDELVRPYVWYSTTSNLGLREKEIPEGVWDGKQSVYAPIRPRKTREEVEVREVKGTVIEERKRSFVEMEGLAEDVD